MAKEIEHKFLVFPDLLPRPLSAGDHLKQGYLSCKPAVRVRIITSGRSSKAFLTIKGPGFRQRSEFEYEIPVNDAKSLMKLCGSRIVRKIRRRIGPWEIDEFKERHAGLWLAECELKSAKAKLPALPEWIGQEVTDDPEYSNSNLAICAINSNPS